MRATVTHDVRSADLVSRLQAGRPGAWPEVVRTYLPLLRSRTRRYRLQDSDALDVIQTTWMRLAENVDRIHTPEHLAGWLATVVSRECQHLLRQSDRAVPVDDVHMEAQPAAVDGPEELAVRAAEAAELRGAVATLAPGRRALIGALFADDDRSYAEIARDLEVPVGSLGPTRARTLRQLRRVLGERGIGS